MNTPDPFGIRSKSSRSSLQFIQAADYFASQAAKGVQHQLRQSVRSAQIPGRSLGVTLPLHTAPTSAMSGANGSTSYDGSNSRPGRRATLMGEKMNDFSNMLAGSDKDQELPMYKDKPYNYAPSQRRKPYYRRPRILALAVVLLLLIFYFLGGSSTLPPAPVPENVREAWKSSQLSKPFDNFLKDSRLPTANWEDRRERVKDAFKITWSAYEQHGWGMYSNHCL